jgi:flavin reductase (DIM6/NTAB) family NADH-FMN oxidoreductase RutF
MENPSRIRRASEAGVDVSAAFREAMSLLAATVVMVTTRVDGRPWGLTISACCSVSASPPMLLISLGQGTVSARAIGEEGVFGVSILGAHQEEAARTGAASGAPKFVERFCRPDELGAGGEATVRTPVLKGAVAHLDCVVERAVDVADHTVFFAEVRDVVLSPGVPPLLYWGRMYTAVDGGDPWYH